MAPGRWAVAAAAVVAVANAATTTQFLPTKFNDRLGSETPVADASLQFLYTMQQAECRDGAFADASSENRLNGMVFDRTSPAKCPEVSFAGETYQIAHNGVQFSGTRGGPKDEFVESVGNVSALALTNELTIEMWLKTGVLGSADENLVLFVIGSEQLPIDGNWVCDSARRDFDAQLTFNPLANSFGFSYRRSVSACFGPNLSFESATPLVSNTVYHVVLTLATGNLPSIYVSPFSAASASGAITGLGFTPDLSTWTPGHKLRIGSNPFVRSSINVPPAPGGSFAWRGSVLSVAFYNKALTPSEVSQNFDAGLPNSAPVYPAAEMLTRSGKEDLRETLDLSAVVPYDFDREALGETTSFTYSVVTGSVTDGVSSASVGSLFVDASAPVPLGAGADFNNETLQFKPATEHAYGFPAKFLVSVRDQLDASSPVPGTVLIGVAAQNDAPEFTSATTKAVSVPQTQSEKITLSALEAQDCAKPQDLAAQTNVPDPSSSCALFGLASFTIENGTEYGKFYTPLTGSECGGLADGTVIGSFPHTIPIVDGTTSTGAKTVSVCFEACVENKATNLCPVDRPNTTVDGVVANETFQFTVTDAAGETETHSLNIMVLSVLQVGGKNTLDHTAVLEDSGFEAITLRSIDFLCEDAFGNTLADAPIECNDRNKTYVLKELPPAYQGMLYEGPSNDTAITSLPEDGLELAGDVVYFKPAADYFSRDSWPLCAASASTNSFTQCVVRDATFLAFPCTGPADMPEGCGFGNAGTITNPAVRYEKHTVTDLEGNLMGGCNATAAEGCPVNIVYTLKVQGQQSRADVGHKIWVTNVHDTAELVLPATEFVDLEKLKNVPIVAGGERVFVDTKGEGDTRVLELELDLALNRGEILFPGAALDASRISEVNGQATKATSGASSFRFVGTASALNELLARLNWIATEQVIGETIKFRFQDVGGARYIGSDKDKDVVEVEKSIKLTLKQEEIAESGLNLTLIALWSSVSAGALLICGACYCVIHAIVRAALRGERVALWFVRNVLLTHIDPHEEHALDHELGVEGAAKDFEDAIRHEKERMERVRFCAHLFHAVCPCICKFDPSQEGALPSAEEMAKAAIHKIKDDLANHHLPPRDGKGRAKSVRLEVAEDEIFDWEVHEHIDEKTGQVLKYYYNPRTDQSSWEKPTIRVRRRES